MYVMITFANINTWGFLLLVNNKFEHIFVLIFTSFVGSALYQFMQLYMSVNWSTLFMDFDIVKVTNCMIIMLWKLK